MTIRLLPAVALSLLLAGRGIGGRHAFARARGNRGSRPLEPARAMARARGEGHAGAARREGRRAPVAGGRSAARGRRATPSRRRPTSRAGAPSPADYVAKLVATSEGALGLRVRLDLGTMPGAMELRAVGDDGRIETMTVDPRLGPEAWTPWTEGPTQTIELFSPVLPGNAARDRLGASCISPQSPWAAKAARDLHARDRVRRGRCDARSRDGRRDRRALDSSVVRISFVNGGSAFLCTATLINTEKFARGLPAHREPLHRQRDASAATITTRWFYDSANALPGPGAQRAAAAAGGGRDAARVRELQRGLDAAVDERSLRPPARRYAAVERRRTSPRAPRS